MPDDKLHDSLDKFAERIKHKRGSDFISAHECLKGDCFVVNLSYGLKNVGGRPRAFQNFLQIKKLLIQNSFYLQPPEVQLETLDAFLDKMEEKNLPIFVEYVQSDRLQRHYSARGYTLVKNQSTVAMKCYFKFPNGANNGN